MASMFKVQLRRLKLESRIETVSKNLHVTGHNRRSCMWSCVYMYENRTVEHSELVVCLFSEVDIDHQQITNKPFEHVVIEQLEVS